MTLKLGSAQQRLSLRASDIPKQFHIWKPSAGQTQRTDPKKSPCCLQRLSARQVDAQRPYGIAVHDLVRARVVDEAELAGADRHHRAVVDAQLQRALQRREQHHVVELLFDRRDPAIKRQAEEVFRVLVREAAAAGYGEYRTHLSFMDDIAATYGWNDNALLKLHQTIKDALDPKGILAPGKSGIWPARYRRSHS